MSKKQEADMKQIPLFLQKVSCIFTITLDVERPKMLW